MFQFDLEYLLEYMLKISDTILSKNPLIKIKNMKQLNKLYEELSKNVDYLSRYYFGFIYSENFKNFYNTKIPSIVLTGINYNDFK